MGDLVDTVVVKVRSVYLLAPQVLGTPKNPYKHNFKYLWYVIQETLKCCIKMSAIIHTQVLRYRLCQSIMIAISLPYIRVPYVDTPFRLK